MPDRSQPDGADPIEELRRAISSRSKRGRKWILAAAGASAALVSLPSLWKAPLILLWNASPSVPVGLYRIGRGRVRKGELVVSAVPRTVKALAGERHYIPQRVPLVKPVAALAGARICAAGPSIFIDGHLAARRLGRDPEGRPMPWWNGCVILRSGQLFLLAPAPLSFDGRYFGPTSTSDVIGPAEFLWAP